MGETFGYTISVIVAGVILLTIATVSFRGQEATVASIEYSSVKQSTVDLISVMDRDFHNLGSNFPFPNMLSDLSLIDYDTASTVHNFDFLAQTERGMPPDTVSYRWTEGTPVTTNGKTYSTITVERYVNGALTGGNSGSITAFSIELKNAIGDPVMDATEVRQIEVRMKMISSLGSDGEIEESRWSETFHPMHMAKQDGISI